MTGAAVQRSTFHSWMVFGPNTILGTSIIYSALRNVDFVSCDVTVLRQHYTTSGHIFPVEGGLQPLHETEVNAVWNQ